MKRNFAIAMLFFVLCKTYANEGGEHPKRHDLRVGNHNLLSKKEREVAIDVHFTYDAWRKTICHGTIAMAPFFYLRSTLYSSPEDERMWQVYGGGAFHYHVQHWKIATGIGIGVRCEREHGRHWRMGGFTEVEFDKDFTSRKKRGTLLLRPEVGPHTWWYQGVLNYQLLNYLGAGIYVQQCKNGLPEEGRCTIGGPRLQVTLKTKITAITLWGTVDLISKKETRESRREGAFGGLLGLELEF